MPDSNLYKRRWVGSLSGSNPGPRGKVQISSEIRDAVRGRTHSELTLPEPVLRLAQAEYEHHFGHSQDYERMQERGGLSLYEVIGLLADYVERLGGKPTEPRGTQD